MVKGERGIRSYRPGSDPRLDAWIANFYTENHLSYEAFPDQVASPEQLRFMVYMGDESYYYPCSDEVFFQIIEKRGGSTLPVAYMKVWERLEPLIKSIVEDKYRLEYLLELLRIKFRHETSSLVILPCRLEKRLLHIFVRASEIDRPLAKIKEEKNRLAHTLVSSQDFSALLNDPEGLDRQGANGLDELELSIWFLKLRRLLALSSNPSLWEPGGRRIGAGELRSMMEGPVEGRGWSWFMERLREWRNGDRRYYLLWMGAEAGQVVVDLMIIRLLIQAGIKVILAVKQDFFYDHITIRDILEDDVLHALTRDADVITDRNISKKALLERLKSDKMLFVISDGTQELFNPLLTSVTFARAFKECDGVVLRCPREGSFIHDSHFRYTRDILTMWTPAPGKIVLREREHDPRTIRFSEADLEAKAESLILHLKMQKARGKTIMFYSAIVGSIPNQLETAKKILKVFVSYLRSKQKDVLVINPAEHFEPGMDADDLMYMWEIVQRSGLIDIWRFQTVEDIEKAFELMGEKVPPEWVGKDATYSTGCTKEMQIAMEVQKENPEMQIIGPPWEKFLRRKEYGVGKLYDRALER